MTKNTLLPFYQQLTLMLNPKTTFRLGKPAEKKKMTIKTRICQIMIKSLNDKI